tara:strand:+ start:484 stop:648 length:165 start_codon:yes stop_codon:yes gene_type:complete
MTRSRAFLPSGIASSEKVFKDEKTVVVMIVNESMDRVQNDLPRPKFYFFKNYSF